MSYHIFGLLDLLDRALKQIKRAVIFLVHHIFIEMLQLQLQLVTIIIFSDFELDVLVPLIHFLTSQSINAHDKETNLEAPVL